MDKYAQAIHEIDRCSNGSAMPTTASVQARTL